jgi:hypothetical protein
MLVNSTFHQISDKKIEPILNCLLHLLQMTFNSKVGARKACSDGNLLISV